MKRVGAKACAALLLLALCLAPLIQPAGIYHRMADLPQAKDPPPDSCYQSFNVGRWMVASASISRPGALVAKRPFAAAAPVVHTSWVAVCTREVRRLNRLLCWGWRVAPAIAGPGQQGRCRPRRVEPAALVELFRGRHLALAGDSHERLLHHHLSRALGGSPKETYHEDSSALINATGVRLDLWFRTLGGDLTALVRGWTESGEAAPDLLVMGGGSWSIKEEGRNVTRWEESLDELAPAIRRYLEALRGRGARAPVLVWATTPLRVKGRAPRPVEVPVELVPVFNAAAVARLVQPAGPFLLLDMYGLTRECWGWCVPDGAHGGGTINGLAIQVLANIYAHALLTRAPPREREGWGGLWRGAVAWFRSAVKPRVMPT